MKKVRSFGKGKGIRDTDIGKPNLVECFSFISWYRYAMYMKTQEKKYAPDNWLKGIPEKEYEKSWLRHIQKYMVLKYQLRGASPLHFHFENHPGQLPDPKCSICVKYKKWEPWIDHWAAAGFNHQGIGHEQELNNNK